MVVRSPATCPVAGHLPPMRAHRSGWRPRGRWRCLCRWSKRHSAYGRDGFRLGQTAWWVIEEFLLWNVLTQAAHLSDFNPELNICSPLEPIAVHEDSGYESLMFDHGGDVWTTSLDFVVALGIRMAWRGVESVCQGQRNASKLSGDTRQAALAEN